MTPSASDERLVTAREACMLLACSRATLYRIPLPRVHVSRRGVRWALAEIRAYIAVNSTDRG
jgi:predicted DNA-binding transcriptional regulator AlpA